MSAVRRVLFGMRGDAESMGYFGGAAGATLLGAPAWVLMRAATANLGIGDRTALTVGLTGLAILIGFLAGGAITQRLVWSPYHVTAFSALAAGMATGVTTGIALATITGAYLATYGAWPDSLSQQALYVLAVPAFGALGWFVGGAAGAVFGALLGSLGRAFRRGLPSGPRA